MSGAISMSPNLSILGRVRLGDLPARRETRSSLNSTRLLSWLLDFAFTPSVSFPFGFFLLHAGEEENKTEPFLVIFDLELVSGSL